jgi:hypothetical protein
LLKEVEENGEGNPEPPLNSTIFLYGDQPNNITTEKGANLPGQLTFFSGDFDADGKTNLANKKMPDLRFCLVHIREKT